MKISRKALPVLLTLNKLNKHFEHLYCFPSQEKLLTLLSKFTSLKISRRQLNYDLAALEAHGILIRVRRHRKHPRHGMEFRSTLYMITNVGYSLLLRAQVITWNTFQAIREKIRNSPRNKPRPCATNPHKSQLTSVSDILRGLVPAPL